MAFCLAPQFAESDMVTLTLSRSTHNLVGWMIIGRATKMQRENDKQEISKMEFVLGIVTKYLFTIGLSSCLMMMPRALVLWHNNDGEEKNEFKAIDCNLILIIMNSMFLLIAKFSLQSKWNKKWKTKKLFCSRKSDQLIQRLFTFFFTLDSLSLHEQSIKQKNGEKNWSQHLSIVCFSCSTSRHLNAEVNDGNV